MGASGSHWMEMDSPLEAVSLEVNSILGAVAECVDGVFSLIGGDGAGELSFVEVQAQISGGDLALGADLEASQR